MHGRRVSGPRRLCHELQAESLWDMALERADQNVLRLQCKHTCSMCGLEGHGHGHGHGHGDKHAMKRALSRIKHSHAHIIYTDDILNGSWGPCERVMAQNSAAS